MKAPDWQSARSYACTSCRNTSSPASAPSGLKPRREHFAQWARAHRADVDNSTEVRSVNPAKGSNLRPPSHTVSHRVTRVKETTPKGVPGGRQTCAPSQVLTHSFAGQEVFSGSRPYSSPPQESRFSRSRSSASSRPALKPNNRKLFAFPFFPLLPQLATPAWLEMVLRYSTLARFLRPTFTLVATWPHYCRRWLILLAQSIIIDTIK
jgi:hypothetical protein